MVNIGNLHIGARDLKGALLSPAFLGLAALVFAAGLVGLLLAGFAGHVAAICTANAIVVVWALKSRREDTLLILAVMICANLAADAFAGDTYVLLSFCDLTEVSLIVFTMRRFGLDRQILQPRMLLRLYAVLIPLPLITALAASLYLKLHVGLPMLATFRLWYGSHALALIIIVPPLMATRLSDFTGLLRRERLGGSLLALAPLGSVILFSLVVHGYPFSFMFYPAVLLATFMRGFAGGTVALTVADSYLLVPVLFGDASWYPQHSTMLFEVTVVLMFAAVISFTVVITGAALEHRRRLEREMSEALIHAEDAREEALVAKNAAEDANRTKSAFLANMSHELRTPLNAVIGFSEILRDEMFGPLGDGRYREYADTIHNAGEHLLELVNDVLDMAKIEAGKFEIQRERIDLAVLIDDCVALMGSRAREAGLKLGVDLPGRPLDLYADRRAVKQILLNLLSNAAKFTPAGGQIVVAAALERDSVGRDVCSVCVRDSGIGIPAEALHRLGNPFVQLRQRAELAQTGTGLGLALVRGLVEMHRGSMHIESDEGVGTAVTIRFPVTAQAVAA